MFIGCLARFTVRRSFAEARGETSGVNAFELARERRDAEARRGAGARGFAPRAEERGLGEEIGEGAVERGLVADGHEAAGMTVGDDRAGAVAGEGEDGAAEGLGLGDGEAEVFVERGVEDEFAGGEEAVDVGVADEAGEADAVGEAEFLREFFQLGEVAGFEAEHFAADDDALDVAVRERQRGEGAEKIFLTFETLQARGHANPARRGLELEARGERGARGAVREARGVHAGPEEAGEVAAGDEMVGGAGAVGDDVRGGDAMDGRRGEAGAFGGVNGPDDREAARPRGESAVNMGAKTVVVDEVDLFVTEQGAEGEDGFGDGGDVAHAMRGVDVDGHVEFAEAFGKGAGAELENLRAEAGAVEVAEEIEQVHLGAADFADAGNPEDFRRGWGGGGFFFGGEAHGRRTPGVGVTPRRRRTEGRRRVGVIFRWERMVSGVSIRCGFQKVAFKVGVGGVARCRRWHAEPAGKPRGRTEGWGGGLRAGFGDVPGGLAVLRASGHFLSP